MKMRKKVTIPIIKKNSEKKRSDISVKVTGTKPEPSHTMNVPEPKTEPTRYSKDRTNGCYNKKNMDEKGSGTTVK